MQTGTGDELGWYSVWAQPSAAEEPPSLRPAMAHLRSLFDGPAFEPHVTVLGVGNRKVSLRQASLSLQSACRALAPYTCCLTRPSSGNTFYQCVYMLVDPSDKVVHANKVVQSIFEAEQLVDGPKSDYMPHLSLLYANLTEEHKKTAKVLVEEKYGSQLCNTEFHVSSLCLYSTDTSDKELVSWKKVAEFPLEG
ncbi:hypothetical protein KP509_32G007300 [Ceratopteris richardii]|uniref:Cyclic phosphodiesterase n=1 Tax=Ceratopteris richardii TaxID=49495 RepID=A0A8T2QSW2_CERRI|nr:hypothetical protein KP509_32G007300 [Ceratopteris richardii]